jgi:hypothetical protein
VGGGDLDSRMTGEDETEAALFPAEAGCFTPEMRQTNKHRIKASNLGLCPFNFFCVVNCIVVPSIHIWSSVVRDKSFVRGETTWETGSTLILNRSVGLQLVLRGRHLLQRFCETALIQLGDIVSLERKLPGCSVAYPIQMCNFGIQCVL